MEYFDKAEFSRLLIVYRDNPQDESIKDTIGRLLIELSEGIARRYCPSEVEREEVIAEMVCRLWIALPKLDPSLNSFSYLTSCASNQIRHVLRCYHADNRKIIRYGLDQHRRLERDGFFKCGWTIPYPS